MHSKKMLRRDSSQMAQVALKIIYLLTFLQLDYEPFDRTALSSPSTSIPRATAGLAGEKAGQSAHHQTAL